MLLCDELMQNLLGKTSSLGHMRLSLCSDGVLDAGVVENRFYLNTSRSTIEYTGYAEVRWMIPTKNPFGMP